MAVRLAHLSPAILRAFPPVRRRRARSSNLRCILHRKGSRSPAASSERAMRPSPSLSTFRCGSPSCFLAGTRGLRRFRLRLLARGIPCVVRRGDAPLRGDAGPRVPGECPAPPRTSRSRGRGKRLRSLGGGPLASSLALRCTRKAALDLSPGKLRSGPPPASAPPHTPRVHRVFAGSMVHRSGAPRAFPI